MRVGIASAPKTKRGANMNLRQFLLAAMVIIGAFSSGNAGVAQHNGDWWRQQTQSAKLQYAARLFDGMTVGLNVLELGMSTEILVKTEPQSAGETAGQKHVHINGGQLVESLDKFYEDSRNSNITVANASIVVVHSVSGTPRSTLLAMIEQLRKPGC
jgi:hypothetical protein